MVSLTARCKLDETGVGLSSSSASLGFIPLGDKRKEGIFPLSSITPSCSHLFPCFWYSLVLAGRRIKTATTRDSLESNSTAADVIYKSERQHGKEKEHKERASVTSEKRTKHNQLSGLENRLQCLLLS